MTPEETLVAIATEMARADQLHGPLSTDPVRAAAILGEEAGEVLAAALGVTRQPPEDTESHLREELVQVAATAIRMLETLNRSSAMLDRNAKMLDIASQYLDDKDKAVRQMSTFILSTIRGK